MAGVRMVSLLGLWIGRIGSGQQCMAGLGNGTQYLLLGNLTHITQPKEMCVATLAASNNVLEPYALTPEYHHLAIILRPCLAIPALLPAEPADKQVGRDSATYGAKGLFCSVEPTEGRGESG
jgi:hypothetical protein